MRLPDRAALERVEQTARPPHREAELRAIEARYRDPAMVHLRAALAAKHGSPAYLEALISFHEHRFADCAASDRGMSTMLIAAKALARTALDLLEDPKLLAEVRREFESA